MNTVIALTIVVWIMWLYTLKFVAFDFDDDWWAKVKWFRLVLKLFFIGLILRGVL